MVANFRGQSRVALFDLLTLSQVELIPVHPVVAAWVMRRVMAIESAPRWQSWRLRERSRRLQRVAGMVGEMTGQLALWSAGKYDDAWFDTDEAR
jgi:hypothetical protein